MNLTDIPEFVEAVSRERLVRDAAFLNLPENVGGYELRQMTLWDFLTLRMMRCPLLFKETPNGLQLATFLWFMSTDYCQSASIRRQFLKRCRHFQKPAPPLFRTRGAMARWEKRVARAAGAWAEVVAACKEYIAETLQDKPHSPPAIGYIPSYYSDACFLTGAIARNYGQSFNDIMKMPLKQIFQFISETKEANGCTPASLSNPSDRVATDYCARLNAPTN